MIIKININDYVEVTLTDYGKQIVDEIREEMKKELQIDPKELYKYDKRGKFSEQMLIIMSMFGKYVYNGSQQVFVNNELTILTSWGAEHDLPAVDGKHGETGRGQESAKAQAEENAGSSPAHPIIDKKNRVVTLCKCGSLIGFVGTKCQHIYKITDKADKQKEFFGDPVDERFGFDVYKVRNRCYHCACTTPEPTGD
jgi:hypothetical protein